MYRPRENTPRIVNYPTPAPRTPLIPTVPHNQRCSLRPDFSAANSFDKMISKMYENSTIKLSDAVLHASFPSQDHRRKCEQFLKSLRIYRHLFMHVYVHLLSCCSGRDLRLLVDKVNVWKEWGSVQQLVHHSSMKQELLDFGRKYPCTQHQILFSRLSNDDESDLLCHLLYCRRKSELYELRDRAANWGRESNAGEPEQVIELIWHFLQGPLPSQFMHRLRAQIYRMTRKSAYIPLAIQISPSAISNEPRQVPGANGAHGMISKAVIGSREVAIKKIKCGDLATLQQCRQMFACEAIVWKTLDHKNIVPFVGVIMEDSLDIRLVSQFFKNGSIRTYVKRHNLKYSSSLARTWAKGLAEGLDYLHSHEPPIIHGDLKADNVLIDDDRCARLCDFGQSHSSDSGKYLDSTRVGLAYNPVNWMAPELIDGGDHAKATAESDMFSFGCVLYEIMSRRIPFEDHHPGEVAWCVKRGERPARPGSIKENDPLWRMANDCWEGLPRNRPSATDIVRRLG